jgi:hypothetical protein
LQRPTLTESQRYYSTERGSLGIISKSRPVLSSDMEQRPTPRGVLLYCGSLPRPNLQRLPPATNPGTTNASYIRRTPSHLPPPNDHPSRRNRQSRLAGEFLLRYPLDGKSFFYPFLRPQTSPLGRNLRPALRRRPGPRNSTTILIPSLTPIPTFTHPNPSPAPK